MAQFSKPVQDWLDSEHIDLDSMTLEQLKEFKTVVEQKVDEDVLLDLSTKLLGNGAYGASSTPSFFFYNIGLASDITAESRETTRYMEQKFDEFFHGEWWDRTDLHEKFGIKLDPAKRKWYEDISFSVYGDTDSTFFTTFVYVNSEGKKCIKHIGDFFNECADKNGVSIIDGTGHELVETSDSVLNWSEADGLHYAPVRYVVRHKVSKPKWKLKTKSGKEIEVTADHSMIVFRDGKKLKVKPADIRATDNILIVEDIAKFNYAFDDIESCECTGEFVDEYVYDLEMADETHTFIANDILVHNSLYCCYGDLFETFTPETVPPTDEAKLDWILRFNKEFLDKWNNEQLNKRFNTRHGKNIHEFELETVAKSGIFLAKKKYTQALVFSKGNRYLEHPKVKGKGVELIKSQTPGLARKILKELVDVLLNRFDAKNKMTFTLEFAQLLAKYREQWMNAPIEDISLSANIGGYSKNVFRFWEIPDILHEIPAGWKPSDGLVDRLERYRNGIKRYIPIFQPGSIDRITAWYVKSSAGMATKGIAHYNMLCEVNNVNYMMQYSGKVKYYYTSPDMSNSSVFAFPAGEYPEWAPECARVHQFQKCIIDPINRFCQAMRIQDMNVDCGVAYSLFG